MVYILIEENWPSIDGKSFGVPHVCPPGTGKTLMASSYQLVTLKAMCSSNWWNTSASVDKCIHTKLVFKRQSSLNNAESKCRAILNRLTILWMVKSYIFLPAFALKNFLYSLRTWKWRGSNLSLAINCTDVCSTILMKICAMILPGNKVNLKHLLVENRVIHIQMNSG